MYEVTIFGIHLNLNPIAFSIPLGGGREWHVYWYGILIALGFVLAILYAVRNAKRFDIDLDRMLDVVLVATPVALLCARIYYVIFDGVKLESIGDFFGFGNSSGVAGIAIYGAVIGAFLAGGLMCWIRKVNILDMFDLASIGFLIGQCVGRWGNFVNQEAYGGFTGSDFWGMTSNKIADEMKSSALVHPCFLYESVWCFIGFFVLHFFSKRRKFKGEVALLYCVWYGFGRAIIETMRTDSLMVGDLRVSCLLSALLCVGALVALLVIRHRVKPKPAADYDSVFVSDNADEAGEGFTLTAEEAAKTSAQIEADSEPLIFHSQQQPEPQEMDSQPTEPSQPESQPAAEKEQKDGETD